MKIKNDSVRIQIGNKKYDFHNLILNEYIKRLINKQLSKESATNLTLTESTILTYLLLKLDTPINNLTQDSSITNYNFDIAIVHGASKHQNISEKQVVMQYDYNILINDYVIDLNLVQQGKKSPETIKYLSDFYDRKITAIGFTTHWYPYKEVPVCAVLDTSNYSIFLERNQDLTISRKDIITTDAEFSTNNKEKVKGPAHLSPLGLPQIIYQPSIVQILKDDEGNDYIKKHEFYDYAKGVLTSVGLSQNPNYIEKEYKIGEDIQAVNNETEIVINGIINDEKEEGNVYPSDELFPIEPRTLPIQSSKGIKETSIKTNEENDFFVNIDGKSTQDGTPTPSNPVEIKSIGESWNIFNKDALAKTSGASKTILDTGVRVTQTSAGDYRYIGIELGKSELLGKTYTISAAISKNANNLPKITMYYGNDSNMTIQTISFNLTTTGKKIFTFPNTFPANCDRVFLLMYSNVNGTGNVGDYADYTNLQVYEGTEEKPYKSYGNNIFIEQKGKNKLINSSFRENWTGWWTSNNGTIPIEITEKLGQKCLHITGELQKAKTVAQHIQERVEKGKTYTLSCMAYLKDYVSGTTNPFISFYTDGKTTDGSWTSGIQTLKGYLDFNNSNYDYSKGFVKITSTFKIKEDTDLTKALGLYVYARDCTGDLYVYDIQLEEGTEATDCEEYFNNTYTLPLSEPLRSLPNGVKDTLEADGIHRRVGRIILDGSENWVFYPNKTNTFRCQMSALISTGLSNYYKRLSSATKFDVDTGIYLEYTNSIIISDPRFSTIDEIKTWLLTHNVEVIYNVRTATEPVIETIEPYTDEQKEIINSMVTEKGTNIFNINEDTGIETVEYEGLYPETVNYKYVVFKYTVYQLVVTGVDSEGVEVQEIKDTGCYYYQAIPLEKFKKMKIKIKYERG